MIDTTYFITLRIVSMPYNAVALRLVLINIYMIDLTLIWNGRPNHAIVLLLLSIDNFI